VAVGKKASGLYTLTSSYEDRAPNHTVNVSRIFSLIDNSTSISCNNLACNLDFLNVLHARLGHTSLFKMQHIATCKPYLSKNFSYDTCVMAKFHKIPFNKSLISTIKPFQLVHMDL